jgi:DNA-binding transcriptional LysR family regulator
MQRHFDLIALRSFVAVADSGGVTRAAGFLNLTQSAVSMQVKRLEDMLQVRLLDRAGRGVVLSAEGEQLLGYARRMLALNDEALRRMTGADYEGEIVLGVPADIIYPTIPMVLRQFARDWPRVKITLVSSFTRALKRQFVHGDCDIILTTEDELDAGGETLRTLPLIWVGAEGGQAWRARPLPLAFEYDHIFRKPVQTALEAAGIDWVMAVEAASSRSIEASLSADLAVHAMVAGSEPRHLERIAHGGALPELPSTKINLYMAAPGRGTMVEVLARTIAQAWHQVG